MEGSDQAPPESQAPDTIAWTPADVRARTGRGAAALVTRQVVVAGLNIIGGVFLARLLTPSEFGLYAIFLLVIGILIAFSDVGLGASLVRAQLEPTLREYRVVFTAQQILLTIGIGIVLVMAPWIAAAYGLPADDAWAFRIAALSLAPVSLQSIATIRLERQLRYDRLALVEIAQAATYNVTAVGLALGGYGAWAFAVALLARSIAGVVFVSLVSRWPVGFAWDIALLRRDLSFGVPFQAASLVSLARDSLSPLVVGLWLGTGDVGSLTWASTLALYPVLALVVLQRLYLPAFSRMIGHPTHLASFVETVLRGTNAIAAPLAMIGLVLAVPITQLIFGEQWLPSLPYFYLFWLGNLVTPTVTPLYGLLNALGRPGTTLRFAVTWTALTWLIGIPLIAAYGAIGFALATAIVQSTGILLCLVARRAVPFRILRAIRPPWTAAVVAGLVLAAITQVSPVTDILRLAVHAAIGIGVYAAVLTLAAPELIRTSLRLVSRPDT